MLDETTRFQPTPETHPARSSEASIFSFLEKTVRVASITVTLPVSLAIDVITLGGALVDRGEPQIVSKGRRIIEGAAEIVDEIAS